MSAARRALTPGEIALARSVFGDAIDYEAAAVARRKWAFFQPRDRAMAPSGCIHFHPADPCYHADFDAARLTDQGVFIHEMTHVWQYQQGIYLILARAPWARYDYAFKPGQPFRRYGLEQQAEIVRHAFLLRKGAQVAGAPALAQYDTLLPFRAG